MAYIIDRPDPEQQFIQDRFKALHYLDKFALKVDGLSAGNKVTHKYLNWIKTEPSYPAFEDFTFSFRNQVCPVLVLWADDSGTLLNPPPRIESLRREAGRNNLIPCVFPIRDRTGRPFFPDTWNLINPFTGKRIDPAAVSSDDPVEVSDWELRNWAVKIVWDHLKSEGLERLSYCDAPEIDPQIWFRDNYGRECWIEVLYSVYPVDTQSMTFSCKSWPEQVLSHDGYAARVGFAGAGGNMSRLFQDTGSSCKLQG